MRVGILSDTHNLLRPEVTAALTETDAILHAGDISSLKILEDLQIIAPVYAVRGNADKEWAEFLPPCLDLELGNLHIYMTHRKKDLPEDLSDYDLVIVGHSHQYKEIWLPPSGKRRTLILNPGSCGSRRFYQPITMAMMTVHDDGWIIKRIELAHAASSGKIDEGNLRKQIEIIVKETEKGRSIEKIADKYHWDPTVVEQIVRLYVTHPGVTAEGIMTKMGL